MFRYKKLEKRIKELEESINGVRKITFYEHKEGGIKSVIMEHRQEIDELGEKIRKLCDYLNIILIQKPPKEFFEKKAKKKCN